MAKRGKRWRSVRVLVDPQKRYAAREAVELLLQAGATKFEETFDLAARLGCAVEAVDLPNEAVDPAEGGHCQLSLTGTFEKGARLRAFCSRTGRTVFDTTFATRTQAYQCLRHTFGLSTLPCPEER